MIFTRYHTDRSGNYVLSLCFKENMVITGWRLYGWQPEEKASNAPRTQHSLDSGYVGFQRLPHKYKEF